MFISCLFWPEDEWLEQMHNVVVTGALTFEIVQNFYLNLGAWVVPLDSADHLHCIILVIFEILTLQCSAKCAITKVANNFIASYFLTNRVIEVASILSSVGTSVRIFRVIIWCAWLLRFRKTLLLWRVPAWLVIFLISMSSVAGIPCVSIRISIIPSISLWFSIASVFIMPLVVSVSRPTSFMGPSILIVCLIFLLGVSPTKWK
mgnify:CR=1 FL=1